MTCELDFSSQSVCTSCESGYYLDTPTLCTKCTTPCANCTDSVTCTDCLPTYTLTVSSCGCNQTASMFYSAITDNCQLCSLIIPNCQTCILISGTFVRCFLCEPGTYLTNLSQTCSPCSSSCTECSSFSTCTVCPIGYTLSIGQCICGPSCALC